MWQSAVLPFSFTGKENNEFFIKSAEKYEKYYGPFYRLDYHIKTWLCRQSVCKAFFLVALRLNKTPGRNQG